MIKIKDPVFAAYLMSRGCTLEGIEPSGRDDPKYYAFNDSIGPEHEMVFLGIRNQRSTCKWRDFIGHISNISKVERLKIDQRSSVVSLTGVEMVSGKKMFVTTDQAVAAFILCEDHASLVHNVHAIKEKQYKFLFPDEDGCIESLVSDMLETNMWENTWWNMKCYYKLATSIRRQAVRKDVRL